MTDCKQGTTESLCWLNGQIMPAQAGIACREETLAPYDLYTADECFLNGTGAELIPVRDIDGRPLRQCPGSVYIRLQQQFRVLIQRETAA